MGFYSRFVFPRLYDCLIDRPFWAQYRREQLASAAGEILEIGVGTGLNLPHYPDAVRRITAIDPNPGMNRRLQKRIGQASIEVDQHLLRSEQLPFDDDSFDCVVSTLTMCSIADVEGALSQWRRVLKPGGRLLFMEHGASPHAKVRRRQRRWNWLQRRLGDGCRLDLDVRKSLETQPFTSLDVDNFYMEQTPKTHGYMYRGVAIK